MREERIWEIDFLRAMAIILMIFFHLVYDLNEFWGREVAILSSFWYWEGKVAVWLFIFLAGISSGFSRNNVRRGLKVLAFALLISLVTYFIFQEQYVRFGILHLLATAMLLFPLLKRLPNVWLLISAAVLLLAAISLRTVLVETSLLLPFGLMYEGFFTIDYYPLFPYLAVFLMGMLPYNKFYYQRRSLFPSLNPGNGSGIWKYVVMISKNSLAIYLLHQPILLALIFFMKWLLHG